MSTKSKYPELTGICKRLEAIAQELVDLEDGEGVPPEDQDRLNDVQGYIGEAIEEIGKLEAE